MPSFGFYFRQVRLVQICLPALVAGETDSHWLGIELLVGLKFNLHWSIWKMEDYISNIYKEIGLNNPSSKIEIL